MKLKYLIASLALTTLALPAQAQSMPKDGGSLKVGIASSIITNGIDPHVIQAESTGWVLGQVAEGLLSFDQNMNNVPWLAQSWTIANSGKTYTFSLQKGVKFHNGREMKADDVKFSLERILNPKTGSLRRQQLSVIERIEVLAPDQIAIHLKHPFSPFLMDLVGIGAPIIAYESVNPDGSITHPIGTGPFSFVEYVEKDHLTLKKFSDYWRNGEPHIDSVTFVPLQDESTRMTALRTGAVDLITSVPAQLLPALTRNKNRGFQLLTGPGSAWTMAIMNTRKPPFDDVRVRQAVNLAIDRQAMIQALTFGFGRADNQIWDNGSFWRMKGDVPQADLVKAKALLAAAGYKDGLPITISCKPDFVGEAQMVQSQLNAVGFQAKIQVIDWVTLKKRMNTYNYHLAISAAGWYADPDSRFGRFYVKTGPANYFAGGYDNSVVAELLASARMESAPNKRKEMYQQIFDIIERDVPSVMLYFSPQSLAWRNEVQDFRTNRQGDLAYADGGLAKVWLKR